MDQEFKNELRDKVSEEKSGLSVEDGKHVLLSCSNCKMDLIDIWITTPEAKIKFKMRAGCAFCGDTSFSQVIEGGFHLGITENTKISEINTLDDEDVQSGEVDASYMIMTVDGRKIK
tara:strand:- start:486 stop:836 length:351 start_codon:yes stop_codon:yes gene_type:complete